MTDPERTAEILDALERTGSFTAAADRLDIAQPSLSLAVRRIESGWEAEVVDRSARPLRLTPAGRMILEAERRVAELRRDCRQSIADLKTGVRGRVVIGVSEYREAFFLTEVLPVFRARYPEVEIFLEEGTTRELERFVLEGRTDLSIGILPLETTGADLASELRIEPLYEEQLRFAMSASNARELGLSGRRLAFSFFHQRPFIIVKEGQMLHRLFENLCRSTQTRPKVVLESESLASAMALSAAGLGATILTDRLLADAARRRPGELADFEIDPPVAPRTVAALLRRNRYVPKAAEALLEVMREAAAGRNAGRKAQPPSAADAEGGSNEAGFAQSK